MSVDSSPVPNHWLLGRLTWDSIPMAHDPIILATFVMVALGGLTVLGVVGLLTGRLDGAGLAGLASIFGGIVTAVAGRPTAPGKDA